MPLLYRPQHFMKKTCSKWCPPIKVHKLGRRLRFWYSHHLLRWAHTTHAVVFLQPIFKLSFQISLHWKYTHNQDEECIMSVKEKGERVPCKSISARYSSWILLHLSFASSYAYSPGKFPIVFCPQDHSHTAWFPFRGDEPASPYLAPVVIPFPANSFIPWSTSDVVLRTVSNMLGLICPKQSALPVCSRKIFALLPINLALSKIIG